MGFGNFAVRIVFATLDALESCIDTLIMGALLETSVAGCL